MDVLKFHELQLSFTKEKKITFKTVKISGWVLREILYTDTLNKYFMVFNGSRLILKN